MTKLSMLLADAAKYSEEYDDNIWYFPVRASEYAKEVDFTFYVEYAICAFFALLIYGLTAYYCFKYRRREGDAIPPHITHNWSLEITWTILPTIICFGMFFVGAGGYLKVMGSAPKDSRVVNVFAKQWKWNFTQRGSTSGTHKSGTLIVEKDKPVQLRMISEDVLHSLFIPGMRSKMDVIPKRITTLNILPIREGEFNLYCTEYCGDQHSMMITTVKVLNSKDFKAATIPMPVMNPYQSFADNCMGCHTIDGSSKTGPTFKGLWGRVGKGKSEGKDIDIVVNEEYIYESLRKPNAIKRHGFESKAMSVFDKNSLDDNEIQALVQWFIKEKETGKFEKNQKWDLKTKKFVEDK